MKLLDKSLSQELITKLVAKFGYADAERIAIQYLYESKPVHIPFLGAFQRSALPLLWFPQGEDKKYIHQVFEDRVEFSETGLAENDSLRKIFVPKVTEFLEKEGIKHVYVVGDADIHTKLYGGVIELEVNDLPKFFDDYFFLDAYFFPRSIECIFVTTHENFAFLAGTQEFIAKFKKVFPEYLHYALQDPHLG